MQYRRWFKRSLVSFLCLGSVYGWVGTPSGLWLTIKALQTVLPGQLKVVGVKGRLIGPIQFKQFVYEDATYRVEIEKLRLDWQKRAFLTARCGIRALNVQTFNVQLKKQIAQPPKKNQKPSGLMLPKIPVGLTRLSLLAANIQQLTVTAPSFTIQASGQLGVRSQLDWTLQYEMPSEVTRQATRELKFQGQIKGDWSKTYLSLEGRSLQPFQWKMPTENSQNSVVNAVEVPRLRIKSIYEQDQWQLKGWLCDAHYRAVGNAIGMTVQLPHYKPKRLPKPRQAIAIHFKTHLSNWKQLADMGMPLHAMGINLQSGDLQIACHVKTTLRYLKRCLEHPERYWFKQKWFNALGHPPLEAHMRLDWQNPIWAKFGMNLKKADLKGDFCHDSIQWQAQCIAKPSDDPLQTALAQWQLKGKTQLEWINARMDSFSWPVKMQTHLQLSGDPMPLFGHTQYAFSVAPKLDIDYTQTQYALSGQLHIPKARLNFQYTDTVVSLDKDVHFVRQGMPKPSLGLPFKVNIDLQLGQDVQCYYAGLNARIAGRLQLVQQDNSALAAKGEINLVEGHYYYYGQALQVEPHSRLIFTEWLYNPKIDIEASRLISIKPNQTILSTAQWHETGLRPKTPATQPTADMRLPKQLTVGVRLRGDFEEPHMSLFSNPPGWVMDPADNLAYILTGQPVSRLNTSAMPILLNTLAQMGTGYMNYHGTAGYIKDKLGVEWDIESEQLTTNTHLIIGKQLNPKWFIAYKLGLSKPEHTVKLSYLMSPAFLIEGSTSNAARGLDLIYQKEFG